MIGSHKASREQKSREEMAYASNNHTFIVDEWKQRVSFQSRRPTTANGSKTFDRWVLYETNKA